jgi:hypothetical protein
VPRVELPGGDIQKTKFSSTYVVKQVKCWINKAQRFNGIAFKAAKNASRSTRAAILKA